MIRKLRTFIVLVVILFTLTGCGGVFDKFEVPNKKFYEITFINPDNNEDTYVSIKYNNKTYIPYGVVSGRIKEGIINECIGYDAKDKNNRYYSLKDNDDFIINYYVNGYNAQAFFYRSTDTKDRDINIPDYIHKQEHEYWN